MSNSFEESINKFNSLTAVIDGEVGKFTNDFSFGDFLQQFVNGLAHNIDEAINEKEISVDSNISSAFYRYLEVLSKNLYIKMPSVNLTELITTANLIMFNWTRMVEEGNLLKEFSLNQTELEAIRNQINDINDICNGASSIENLIKITNLLINKSNEVLAAVPQAFEISRHFVDALKNQE